MRHKELPQCSSLGKQPWLAPPFPSARFPLTSLFVINVVRRETSSFASTISLLSRFRDSLPLGARARAPPAMISHATITTEEAGLLRIRG